MKKYFYCLLMSALSIALILSCVNGDSFDLPEKKAELNISELNVNADSDGGEFKIAYTITNPVEGETLTVTNDDEWITSLSSDASEITFCILPNSTADVREAEIVVKYSEIIKTITVKQEGRSTIAKENIIGIWNVLGDKWDLESGNGICYLRGSDGLVKDEDGNYVTITIQEFCEQYAADYNADPANKETIQPEDCTNKLYEDTGLGGTFTIDENHILFMWGSKSCEIMMVDGDYEYNEAEGYMEVNDLAIPDVPRNLQVDVFIDQDGLMCFRYTEYYIVEIFNYDKSESYWIYAPTIFYCERAETDL